MKIKNEITVGVTINVDEATAVACLKIVEIFLNQHHELDISRNQRTDGYVTYDFGEVFPFEN